MMTLEERKKRVRDLQAKILHQALNIARLRAFGSYCNPKGGEVRVIENEQRHWEEVLQKQIRLAAQ